MTIVIINKNSHSKKSYCKKLYTVLLMTFCAQFLPSHSYAIDIPLFKATYAANFKGLDITATPSWAASIDETSAFTWQRNNIKPIRYQYLQKTLGRKKQRSLTFDWQNNKIISKEKGQATVTPNTELALDRLSYQLQLQHALLNNPESLKTLEYKIADGDKIKQ